MKRFLSLCLVLVMSLCLTTPGFAVDSCCGDEGIMPYGLPCPECGGNVSSTTKWDTSTEVRKDSRKCTHGRPLGDDVYYEQSGIYTIRCVQCKYGYSERVTRGYWKCFGHY